MKEYGIRQAKAHLSEIVREAAIGECSIVTDNRKPVAMIGPLPADFVDAQDAAATAEDTKPLSDATAFRDALFSAPHPFELPF